MWGNFQHLFLKASVARWEEGSWMVSLVPDGQLHGIFSITFLFCQPYTQFANRLCSLQCYLIHDDWFSTVSCALSFSSSCTVGPTYFNWIWSWIIPNWRWSWYWTIRFEWAWGTRTKYSRFKPGKAKSEWQSRWIKLWGKITNTNIPTSKGDYITTSEWDSTARQTRMRRPNPSETQKNKSRHFEQLIYSEIRLENIDTLTLKWLCSIQSSNRLIC